MQNTCRNGILFPILFWPTVRKKGSRDREKLLKFEADGWELATFLRSLEQFFLIETECFFDNVPGSSSDLIQ
jgi:hypothetical protein